MKEMFDSKSEIPKKNYEAQSKPRLLNSICIKAGKLLLSISVDHAGKYRTHLRLIRWKESYFRS